MLLSWSIRASSSSSADGNGCACSRSRGSRYKVYDCSCRTMSASIGFENGAVGGQLSVR